MSTTMPPLQRLLNEKLEDRDWTRVELANRIDIAPMSVSKWLNGKDPIPWHRFLDLCRTLEIPLLTFLRAAREEQPDHVDRFERFIGKNLPPKMRRQL